VFFNKNRKYSESKSVEREESKKMGAMFSEEKKESFFETCKMKRIVVRQYILRREKN